ncbi:MAG: alpha/beta fold hydrolase [Planctomycetes bacterium]|nr:alpha/beta fold hydrolase [Planctomycetota bacterium]
MGFTLRWRKAGIVCCGGLSAAMAVSQIAAYFHARALTCFERGGERTAPPEALTGLQKLDALVRGVRITRPTNERTPEAVGLEFEDCRAKARDGSVVAYWHVPRKDAEAGVVLFHGYAGSRSSLLGQAALIHAAGYAQILVDFRGSGESDGDRTTLGILESNDVEAAWTAAVERWPEKRIVLWGQSMGAAAILRAAARPVALRADAIVLEAPFDRLRTTVSHRVRSMGLLDFYVSDSLLYWGGFFLGVDALSYAPIEDSRSVSLTSLMVHGERDPRVRVEEARALFSSLAGKKRYRSLPDEGHPPFSGESYRTILGELESLLR